MLVTILLTNHIMRSIGHEQWWEKYHVIQSIEVRTVSRGRSHSSPMKLIRKTFRFLPRFKIRARWICSLTKSLHTQVCRRSLRNHGVSNTDFLVNIFIIMCSNFSCYKESLWPSCESSETIITLNYVSLCRNLFRYPIVYYVCTSRKYTQFQARYRFKAAERFCQMIASCCVITWNCL